MQRMGMKNLEPGTARSVDNAQDGILGLDNGCLIYRRQPCSRIIALLALPPVMEMRSSSFPTWMSAPVSTRRREIVAPLNDVSDCHMVSCV
jgi:hypothetical protein